MAHIRAIDVFTAGASWSWTTPPRRNLELTENLRAGEKKDTLLSVLDHTEDGHGLPGNARRDQPAPHLPHGHPGPAGAVRELYDDNVRRGELLANLKRIGDLQRIMSRVIYGTANARDLHALGQVQPPRCRISCCSCATSRAPMLRQIRGMDTLSALSAEIQKNHLSTSPPSLSGRAA
jgi:DNA mismatch repair ATPase MutS